MIPLVADPEGIDWTYEDIAREMDDLGMQEMEIELDSGARLELEDEGARAQGADDDIARAVEEIELHDEGA